jgi:hypothetical protein
MLSIAFKNKYGVADDDQVRKCRSGLKWTDGLFGSQCDDVLDVKL